MTLDDTTPRTNRQPTEETFSTGTRTGDRPRPGRRFSRPPVDGERDAPLVPMIQTPKDGEPTDLATSALRRELRAIGRRLDRIERELGERSTEEPRTDRGRRPEGSR
ncbi:MAG: hypothetical protein V5A46_06935 [Haloferacaceae archaeon]